jgi:hypothetical protein
MNGILKDSTCCRGHISSRYPLSDFTGGSMRRPEVLFTSLWTEFCQFVAKRHVLQTKKQDPYEILLIDPFDY